MGEHIIKIEPTSCVGCGLCVKDCPGKNIGVDANTAVIKSQACLKCGHCVAICPKNAVSMTGFPEPPMEFVNQPRLDADELLSALKARRSVRHFTNDAVSKEIIKKIIDAGRWTPTAKNKKSISYIVLQSDKNTAEALAVNFFRTLKPLVKPFSKLIKRMNVADDFFFKGAPAVIVVVSKDSVSGALAASNMALMAESCGLGVLYSGFFSIAVNLCSKLKKLLGLSSKDKVVTTLVLGHSAVSYCRSTQKEYVEVDFR